MSQTALSLLKDNRVNCYSALFEETINDYLDFIEKPYESKGGIEGQREPLKTSAAIRIRNRMVEDLKSGAVLPPIVVGIVLSEDEFTEVEEEHFDLHNKIHEKIGENHVFIIDGMQRTTALLEATADSIETRTRKIRIEYLDFR